MRNNQSQNDYLPPTSMAEAWEHHQKDIFQSPPVSLQDLVRDAFFAGAMYLHGLTRDCIRLAKANDADGLQKMRALEKELLTYFDEQTKP